MEDLAEFEALFRVEHPRLVALALGLTGDREVARELAQNALAKAFASWADVRRHEHPAAWLRRVVVNEAIDVQRRRAVEREALRRLRSVVVEPDPGSDPVASDWWLALRALPDRQRIAAALFYVDEYSIAEIAAVMGVRQGTVKATLSHARRRLTALMPRAEERT